MAVASNGLVSFSPESRPVDWRVLIAQACLYQALLRMLREFSCPATETDWMKYLRLDQSDDFRWKEAGHTPTLEDTLDAAYGYLRQNVVAPRIGQHHENRPS
jgi:hypothetical protein